MSTSNNQYKVVFIVDVNQGHDIPPDSRYFEFCKQKITLCSFRLLTYFSELSNQGVKSKGKTKHQNLQWGFKFFNSNSLNIKVEQHDFRDFKLRFFDEFEKEVGKRILESKNVDSKGNAAHKKHPCQFVGCALKELFTDFQWETPDLLSPVKRTLRKKNPGTEKNLSHQGNLAFLFTKCPQTPHSLRQFAGKVVLDEEILVDALFGQAVLQSFKTHNLQLFWIDHLHSYDTLDIKSLNIVDEALKKANGRLLPLSAISQVSQPFSSNLVIRESLKLEIGDDVSEEYNKKKIPEKVLNSIVPFSSVIEWYTHSAKADSVGHDKACRVIVYLPTISQEEESLILHAVKVCQTQSPDQDTAAQKRPDIDLNTCLGYDAVYDGYQYSEEKLSDDAEFRVYGMLSSEVGKKSTCEVHNTYICSSVPCSGEVNDVFEKLVLQLSTEKKSLVLSRRFSPVLYILQPLSSTSATISSLSWNQTINTEKKLLSVSDEGFTSNEGKSDTMEKIDKDWSTMVSRLCAERMSSATEKIKSPTGKKAVVKSFNVQITEKHFLPGSRKMLVSLIDKLSERASQLEFLSSEEVSFLKDLQKSYRRENQPIKPLVSTPVVKNTKSGSNTKETFTKESENEAESRKLSVGSVSSRGQMLLNRIKKTSMSTPENINDTKIEPTGQHPLPTTSIDFKDEEELKTYLLDVYSEMFTSENSLLSSAQMIVTVALHFMKEQSHDNPQETCLSFLRKHFICHPKDLREKYQQSNSAGEKQQKVIEFQMQILLRFECLSSLQTVDQSFSEDTFQIEEIVTLLRTLTFSSEPQVLSEFMRNVLVENYVHTLPQTLGNIYDELMQPLPEILESILSPDKSGTESIFSHSLPSHEADHSQNMSIDVISASQPVSTKQDVLLNRSKKDSRGRKLVHHPSLADMGSQRQIFVNTKIPSEKEKKKLKSKVKKDLGKAFHHEKVKLERRQSVAIMESVRQSPRHKKKIISSKLKSPKGMISPPTRSPTCRKIIAETPSHKQKARPVWKQQEKERRRTCSIIDIKVITESPVKEGKAKDSPSQKRKAMHLVRRSFYSAGPIKRTRSLVQSIQLADKISGKKRHTSGRLSSILLKNSPTVTTETFKSPDKNSSFLLSQLIGSPTTPGKTKTPLKNCTSAKCLLESPSMNTRSRSPALSGAKPKALFQDSPLKHMPDSSKKSEKTLGSVKKTVSFGFVGNVSPSSQKTPVKSDNLILMSPSQNTRSKVSCTPTRQSVRAVLFGRSPESKRNRQQEGMSSMRKKRVNDMKDENVSKISTTKAMSVVSDDATVSELGRNKFLIRSPVQISAKHKTSSDLGEVIDNNFPTENEKKLQDKAMEKNTKETVVQKTPSPLKTKKRKRVTPSPGEKLINTPNSLDKWPRKKRCTDLNSPQSVCNSVFSGSKSSKSLFHTVDEKGDNLKLEDIDTITELSPLKALSQSTSSVLSKKRTLQLSPENTTLNFSPSKRQKTDQNLKKKSHPPSSHPASVLSQENKVDTRLSYSLHSRILSQKISSFGSGASEGFSVNNLGSQQSLRSVSQIHSQQSLGSLSQISWGSEDYFSSTNDEVFINSQVQVDSSNNEERSESPIFGSSRKRFQNSLEGTTATKHLLEKNSPSTSENTKLSPGKKFSPNVSAKSLMHLMNSPLLKSPVPKVENGQQLISPKIDQDSLNVRRQKMSGRSRRSLNLHK